MAAASDRDRVIRGYIDGRTWDLNPEFVLIRELVRGGHAGLAGFPLLYDYEWEVHPGRSDGGRGDLVFTDGIGNFAVVEAKYIDTSRTGATVRAKRTESRSKVREQARAYADALRRVLPDEVRTVRAFALTNESGLLEER